MSLILFCVGVYLILSGEHPIIAVILIIAALTH